MNNEKLNIKVGLDTSQFDSSLKGMKKELRELEKVDFSILSDEDAKRVISRMGDLKSSIGDVEQEMRQADPGNFFNSFSTLAGPAIAGISGMAVGMELFGVESEKVNDIQRNLMATISILSSLQTIADADKLKTLMKMIPLQYQELKNKLTSVLTIKTETAAVVANTAAKESGGNAIKKITILQKLWNKAVSANPILVLVAAIGALITGVALMSKHISDNNQELKNSEKAIDGTYIKNEELRKSHNESIKTLRDLSLEYRKTTGSISEHEYQIEQLNNQYKDNIYTIEQEYAKKTEEAVKNSTTFWNGLWDTLRAGGNTQIAMFYQTKREVEAAADVYVEKYKKIETETSASNQRMLIRQETFNKEMLSMIEMLNSETITDEIKKLENIRDQRLKDIEKSKADEVLKQEAILLVNKNYRDAVLKIEKDKIDKQNELRKKSLEEMNSFMTSLYSDDISDQEKDIKGIKDNAEKLKESLDLAFPTDMDKRSSEYVNAVNKIKEAVEAYTNKIKDEYKELYSKELFEFRVANNLASLNEMENNEIESLKKMDNFNKLTEEEKNKLILSIKIKYDDKEFELEKQKVDRLTKYGIDTRTRMYEIELAELAKARNDELITEEQFLQARENLRNKYNDDYLAKQQLQKDAEVEMKYAKEQMLYTAVDGLMNLMTQNQSVRHQEEMDRLSQEYDRKIGYLDKELKYGNLTQEEYNQRRDELLKKQAEEEKKLKEKQARDQKRMAIFQVGIDTAMAIAKTLATFGVPIGIPLMAMAASMGALQASLIAAQPLPKFRTGSKEPFEETGNAYLHEGEMVLRKEVVDYGNNADIIRKLNQNPIGDLSLNRNNGISMREMIEYVNISFERYNQIPVVVKESEITDIQNLVKTIRVNSQTS